jgi:hypothetical protein
MRNCILHTHTRARARTQFIVHSFIDLFCRSGPDIELVIKKLDCKETIKSTTITDKLRMIKDICTPLELRNRVGDIINHSLA